MIKGRSEDILKTYKHHYKYFLDFLCYYTKSNRPTADIVNLKTMEDYIRYLQDVRGITNNITINSYMQNVSPVIKSGFKKGYINFDFKIPFIKVQEMFKEIYTKGELQELLLRPRTNNFVDIRDWGIIWTLSSTGIRAKELRNSQVKVVDLYNRCIAVNKIKNRKARYLPISISLCEVLEEYQILISNSI